MTNIQTLLTEYKKIPYAAEFDIQAGDFAIFSLNEQGISIETVSGFVKDSIYDDVLVLNNREIDEYKDDWKLTGLYRKLVKETPQRKLPTEPGYFLRNGKKLIRMRLQNTGEPMWERAEWITIQPDKVEELEMKLRCGLPLQRLIEEK